MLLSLIWSEQKQLLAAAAAAVAAKPVSAAGRLRIFRDGGTVSR